MPYRFVPRVVLVLTLAGCNTIDPSETENGFCPELAARECQALAAACNREPVECQRIRTEVCTGWVTTAKQAGRSFRRDNVEGCLEQTRTTYVKPLITASDLRALDDKCERVYEGNAAANDVCTADADCRSPMICDRNRCGMPRTVAENANCGNPGESCQAAQYCKAADGFSVCTARMTSGSVCATQIECADAFRCRGGSCIDKLMLNGVCDRDDDCLSGYCDRYVPAGVQPSCAAGLNFARFSPSCDAYFGSATGTR
jgi:hypothetical protein